MDPIFVTKAFLPDKAVYDQLLNEVWESKWLTNNGDKVLSLEKKLREYVGTNNLLYTNNGTIAIQLALKALHISGEVITTPFSYCATTTSLLWENCQPIFVDIDPRSFNIDPQKIEAAITPQTTAILATHVYGRMCDVEAIEQIALKHSLKVIYDGAHAFGTTYKGKSALVYGDVTTCSFHATKLFHTVEGGAIITKQKDLCDSLYHMRSFGHVGDTHHVMGINGKSSEFHACMGLAVLPSVPELIAKRKSISEIYDRLIDSSKIQRPTGTLEGEDYNHAYYSVLFDSEVVLMKITKILEQNGIFIRRYFYPSLNQLPYLSNTQPCPISEDISSRVACLPVFHDLSPEQQERIANIINQALNT